MQFMSFICTDVWISCIHVHTLYRIHHRMKYLSLHVLQCSVRVLIKFLVSTFFSSDTVCHFWNVSFSTAVKPDRVSWGNWPQCDASGPGRLKTSFPKRKKHEYELNKQNFQYRYEKDRNSKLQNEGTNTRRSDRNETGCEIPKTASNKLFLWRRFPEKLQVSESLQHLYV